MGHPAEDGRTGKCIENTVFTAEDFLFIDVRIHKGLKQSSAFKNITSGLIAELMEELQTKIDIRRIDRAEDKSF